MYKIYSLFTTATGPPFSNSGTWKGHGFSYGVRTSKVQLVICASRFYTKSMQRFFFIFIFLPLQFLIPNYDKKIKVSHFGHKMKLLVCEWTQFRAPNRNDNNIVLLCEPLYRHSSTLAYFSVVIQQCYEWAASIRINSWLFAKHSESNQHHSHSSTLLLP